MKILLVKANSLPPCCCCYCCLIPFWERPIHGAFSCHYILIGLRLLNDLVDLILGYPVVCCVAFAQDECLFVFFVIEILRTCSVPRQKIDLYLA